MSLYSERLNEALRGHCSASLINENVIQSGQDDHSRGGRAGRRLVSWFIALLAETRQQLAAYARQIAPNQQFILQKHRNGREFFNVFNAFVQWFIQGEGST